jgi:hypothetical protein
VLFGTGGITELPMAESQESQIDLERTLRLMDVADEIRRQRRRVTEHLEVSDREKIRDHLLKRYKEMGHEADPALIDEAIETVLSERYRFEEPEGGLGLKLARLYVNRGRLLRRRVLPVVLVLGLIVVVALGLRGFQQRRAGEEESNIESYTAQVTELRGRIEGLAQEDAARDRARQLHEEARTEIRSKDLNGLRDAAEQLSELQETLKQEYTLVILRGRERDGTRHYLIVQALDSQDRPVRVRIRNQETGKVESVLEWGERVSEDVYRRVERDYREDNVIDDNVFGRKLRGYLESERKYPDLGQITEY